MQVFALVGCVSVSGQRSDDASYSDHVGPVVPEGREEHGFRSVCQVNIIVLLKLSRFMFKGLCSAVSMLGSAATYIIGPMMVSATSDGPSSRFVLRIQIMHMMYTCTET